MEITNLIDITSEEKNLVQNSLSIQDNQSRQFKLFYSSTVDDCFKFIIQNLTPNQHVKLNQYISQANNLMQIHLVYVKEIPDNEVFIGSSSMYLL